MKKHILLSLIDQKLLVKLLEKGVYPLRISMFVNGSDMGSELVYIEDEQGMILGTTHIPDPMTLMQIYTIAIKPMPKYPSGIGPAIVGENGPEIIFPNGDKEKRPFGFQIPDPDGKLLDALNKFSTDERFYPKLERFRLKESPDGWNDAFTREKMKTWSVKLSDPRHWFEESLEKSDINGLPKLLSDCIETEDFEKAAIVKKHIDKRNENNIP